MDRQSISLASALQTDQNEALELKLAFNFNDIKAITFLMPFILHTVSSGFDNESIVLDDSSVSLIRNIKNFKSYIQKFKGRLRNTRDFEKKYLILWTSSNLPYPFDYIACNTLDRTLIIQHFIRDMHYYAEYIPIHMSIRYIFLIEEKQRDKRLYLHYGDFGKFKDLFPGGSLIEDNLSDTDSERWFPVWPYQNGSH